MITVTFFYRSGQAESDVVDSHLANLRDSIPFELVRIDVDSDTGLASAYGTRAPVVQVGPFVLKNPIGVMDLEIALRSAQDRESHLTKTNNPDYHKRLKRGHSFSTLDKVVLWLSHHYVALFNGILTFFIGLAFAAPYFLKIGWETPARVIYTIYSPLCHQLSFRSWFIFGEQAFYPRSLANIQGVQSFEEAFRLPATIDEKTDAFIFDARVYEGDENLGYKSALCQRDLAIYSSFLLFGVVFAINQRRNKPVKWLIWLFIGVLPMALDGLTQMPGLMAGLPDWLPVRESTPFLRTLTGGLFGFTSAWYLFPFIEESMRDTRAILMTKKAVANQTALGEK